MMCKLPLPPQSLWLLLAATAFLCHPAGAQQTGGDPFGDVGAGTGAGPRDNTRVQGTVFNTAGEVMSDVHIWVTNDAAPANRVRAKTRPTGNYLVRNVASLYQPEDIEGILLRVLFQKEGYEDLQTLVGVVKNGIERINVYMLETGETAEMSGTCAALAGRVVNRKGRGAKGVTVRVLSLDGEELIPPIAAEKRGDWEAILWNVDVDEVTVEATGKEGTNRTNVKLEADNEPQVFTAQKVELTLGG